MYWINWWSLSSLAQAPVQPHGLEPSSTALSLKVPRQFSSAGWDIRELTHSFIQTLNYVHASKSGCTCLVVVICQFNFGGEGRSREVTACQRQAPAVQKCCCRRSEADLLPGSLSRSAYMSMARNDRLPGCVHTPALMLSRLDISTGCPCDTAVFKLYQG